MSLVDCMPRRFRKKPVEIEAMQWTGQNYCDIKKFIGESLEDAWNVGGYCFIDTLQGRFHVAPGSWVIHGVRGEFYACHPDIFEETYEPCSRD